MTRLLIIIICTSERADVMTEMLPVFIKYIDSMIGVVALITALYVLIACRTMTASVVETQKHLSETKEKEHSDLRRKIDETQSKQSNDFQLRNMCVQQHDFINQRLATFERWVTGLEKKLDEHTTQILTAIRGRNEVEKK